MGWTQEYLAQLIDRTSHTVMYMETRGQHPSLNVFYQVVTLLDISVDRFFFTNRHNKESERRQRIDMLLDSLDERELSVIEATAEGACPCAAPPSARRLADGRTACRCSPAPSTTWAYAPGGSRAEDHRTYHRIHPAPVPRQVSDRGYSSRMLLFDLLFCSIKTVLLQFSLISKIASISRKESLPVIRYKITSRSNFGK